MVSLMLNGLVISPDTWPLGMVGRGHVTAGVKERTAKNKFHRINACLHRLFEIHTITIPRSYSLHFKT